MKVFTLLEVFACLTIHPLLLLLLSLKCDVCHSKFLSQLLYTFSLSYCATSTDAFRMSSFSMLCSSDVTTVSVTIIERVIIYSILLLFQLATA